MWPFRRAKTVSQPDLLSVLAGGGLPVGAGTLIEDAASSAALQCAASLWSNAMASASGGPLPADCLAFIGREIILRGQAVLLLDTSMGSLRFIPVWNVDVSGHNPFREQWDYRCSINSPDASTYVRVKGSGIVHLTFNTPDPVRPWVGVPPWNTTTAATLGSVEGRLKNEARTPFGYLLPSRDRRASPTDDAAEDKGFDFGNLNGKLVTTGGIPAELGSGQVANPQQRYSPIRLGMDLPQTLVQFRKDVERSVFLTCGVPPSLTDTSDGTSQRGLFRLSCG